MLSYSLAEERGGIVPSERANVTLQDEVAQLFLEAREDVYRYLLGLGLYPPQAQEGVQEAFLRLYANLKKGEKIQNQRAWIFRVAHNLGLKIRMRQASQTPFDAALRSHIPSSNPDPERTLPDPDRHLHFHKPIHRLS